MGGFFAVRVALFIPCYVDLVNPEVGVSVVRILRKLGVGVVYPERQTCCGQPAFNSGFFDESRGGARHEGRAVFHTGCHQRRELGLLNEPRELLQNVEGLELLDWKNEQLCCGFGGTFAVKMPDVSVAMADEKIQALEESGADTLISGDSSCLMHLKGRLRRTGHDTRVYHLAQILDPENGPVSTTETSETGV